MSFIEIADCVESYRPVDMHDTINGKEDIALASFESAGIEVDKLSMDHYSKWLPLAALEYNISKNIRDYVVVPVTIMPSDLPNRNAVAFPFKQLMSFGPEIGTINYRSWRGKPCHVDHVNKDWTIAKGVVLDVAMPLIPKSAGKLSKVVTLCAFDRTRDAKLVNSILTGERPSYSMGARVEDYTCSICEARRSEGGCEHVTHGKPEFKIYNGELAYYNVVRPIGIEVSNVATGAYFSATNKNTINMGEL